MKKKSRSPTPKEILFTEHYLRTFNATDAARKAGYSERTARQQGYENLTKPYIQDYIQEKTSATLEILGITQEKVIRELARIALEIAERENLQSRLKYLENLLSNGEKAILIYSASFLDEKQFAINLFKKGFCRNINDYYLISPNHKKLIFSNGLPTVCQKTQKPSRIDSEGV